MGPIFAARWSASSALGVPTRAERFRGRLLVRAVLERRPPAVLVKRVCEGVHGLGPAAGAQPVDRRHEERAERLAVNPWKQVAEQWLGARVASRGHLRNQRLALRRLELAQHAQQHVVGRFAAIVHDRADGFALYARLGVLEERLERRGFRSAELGKEIGRGAADFPVRRVQQLARRFAAARAEPDEDLANAAAALGSCSVASTSASV